MHLCLTGTLTSTGKIVCLCTQQRWYGCQGPCEGPRAYSAMISMNNLVLFLFSLALILCFKFFAEKVKQFWIWYYGRFLAQGGYGLKFMLMGEIKRERVKVIFDIHVNCICHSSVFIRGPTCFPLTGARVIVLFGTHVNCICLPFWCTC